MTTSIYTTVGSNNLPAAKVFYDALLGSIGMAGLFDHPSGGRVYGINGKIFFGVLGPFDGRPASVGNGSMVGFSCASADEVAALHVKALELGGTDDGAPGERAPQMHFAYFRDLDGNKLCAFNIGYPSS